MDRQRRALALALGLVCALLFLGCLPAGLDGGETERLLADLCRNQEQLGIPGQVVLAEVLHTRVGRENGTRCKTLLVQVTAQADAVAWTGTCTLSYLAKGLGWSLAGTEGPEAWTARPLSGVDGDTIRTCLQACLEAGGYDQAALVGRSTDLETGTDQLWVQASRRTPAGTQAVTLTFRWRFDPDLPGYVLER